MADATLNKRGDHPRLHAFLRRAWITVAILVGIGLFGVGADQVTASMCDSCHEIAPQVSTKESSGHAEVKCPACHEGNMPWYRFPETLGKRVVMLTRNIGPHLSHELGEADPLARLSVEVEDARCLECHEPSREVSRRDTGTLINHTEHSEANGSCISCHRFTAHPPPDVDRALLFMEQCFACHGTPGEPDASAECDACHPSSFDLLPASHKPTEWNEETHGDAAKVDRKQCKMCHADDVCSSCHGLDMPHPEDWAEGDTVHGPVARLQRGTCTQCHGEDPDYCTVCHHEDYDSTEGPWVRQHPVTVTQRGGAYCLDCHQASSCVECHTRRRGPGARGRNSAG